MTWGALLVEFGGLRIRPDKAIFISRFEFVRVLSQGLQIRNTVVTRPRGEDIVKNQSAQRGVSAGASSANGHAFTIDIVALLQISTRIDAVLNTDDTPAPRLPVAIAAAIARAS